MTVKLIPVEQCFDEAEDIVPQFNFLETDSPDFHFMRLQTQGDLIANKDYGVKSRNPEHLDKCRAALKIAQTRNVDVLLTPEYCIPLSLVDEIVAHPDLQPQHNKLWCLCCEGIPYQEFYEYLGKWADYSHVGKKALKNINPSSFVGSLLYIFQSVHGRLCIVPQSKIQPMREEIHLCERTGLSQGKHIVLFGENSPNMLATVICADSYHQDIKESRIFLPNDVEKKYIILHPQLNGSPRNGEMSALRNNMFGRECGQHTVYITANWASGTKIQLENNPVQSLVVAPWSSIYRRSISYGENGWRENLRAVREQNMKYGLGFGFVKKLKYKVWYSHKAEHINVSLIRKPYGGNQAISRTPGTVLSLCSFVPDASINGWAPDQLLFDNSLPQMLINEATGDYDYPVTANTTDRDKFFSYSLGQREEDELYLNDSEISRRISYHIDDDCEPQRVIYATKVSNLIRCMKSLPNVELPSQLKRLKGGFKLFLAEPLNIIAKDPREPDGALTIYVDSNNEMKKMYDQSVKTHGYIYTNKICVFSVAPFTGEILHYPPHNDKVSALERVEATYDYTVGGVSIENSSD